MLDKDSLVLDSLGEAGRIAVKKRENVLKKAKNENAHNVGKVRESDVAYCRPRIAKHPAIVTSVF